MRVIAQVLPVGRPTCNGRVYSEAMLQRAFANQAPVTHMNMGVSGGITQPPRIMIFRDRPNPDLSSEISLHDVVGVVNSVSIERCPVEQKDGVGMDENLTIECVITDPATAEMIRAGASGIAARFVGSLGGNHQPVDDLEFHSFALMPRNDTPHFNLVHPAIVVLTCPPVDEEEEV